MEEAETAEEQAMSEEEEKEEDAPRGSEQLDQPTIMMGFSMSPLKLGNEIVKVLKLCSCVVLKFGCSSIGIAKMYPPSDEKVYF